jgi:hypothetical protein
MSLLASGTTTLTASQSYSCLLDEKYANVGAFVGAGDTREREIAVIVEATTGTVTVRLARSVADGDETLSTAVLSAIAAGTHGHLEIHSGARWDVCIVDDGAGSEVRWEIWAIDTDTVE